MNVILTAGYNNTHPDRSPLSLYRGRLWIDEQIDQLIELGHRVTVVLGDEWAEEVLVKSTSLINCELVFDANGKDASLYTNIKSGLAAMDTLSSVLPIDTPCPGKEVWQGLLHHNHNLGTFHEVHWVQLFEISKEKALPVFPILITQQGHRAIRKMDNFRGIDDPRLVYNCFPLIKNRLTTRPNSSSEPTLNEPNG